MSDDSLMKKFESNSFLFAGNSAYLEELFEVYLDDPQKVPEQWQQCFAKMPMVNGVAADHSHAQIRQQFKDTGRRRHVAAPVSGDVEHERKLNRVMRLISAYRSCGHHHAKLDPLQAPRPERPDLTLEYHGLTKNDLAIEFNCNSYLGISGSQASLGEIYESLKKTYSGSIGIEYTHITDPEQTHWLEQRIESNQCQPQFSNPEKKKILSHLIAAEELERYLGNRYVGQKRFSLEGGDSLIPLLLNMVERAGSQGVKEFVIGMAHRGRLNVLINVLGKAPAQLFQEFEGKLIEEGRTGDVKYHLGFSSDLRTQGGLLHLTLGFNPSHLEIIAPVIEGSVRARQDRRKDHEHDQVLPLVIHGDAAVAGQGVVMETLNMSQARGYRTGGTVHVIINNQIGFTTSNPLDSRSTLYCSDIMKVVQAPVLHVNGDDPEAVVFAAEIAFDFRMRFKKDVVIDLVCYRRHGHNEADEPSITQPLMYQKIRSHPVTAEIYKDSLTIENCVSQPDVDRLRQEYRDNLEAGHAVVDVIDDDDEEVTDFHVDWSPYLNQKWATQVDTTMSLERIKKLGRSLVSVPEGFAIQRQVQREYDARTKMIAGEIPLNWGCAEALAYAGLLDEGYPVRISGQDSCRGTFSHRQAVLHDNKTGELYTPLANLNDTQENLTIIDSVLSEEAVLGFEYGYTTADPKTLVIWEAQFGDFVNGAQVVIDQFISSGYQKWGRLCGLAMFLPHGYEGMGPEHSSARLERFMQLAAQHNIQVCTPTTPAQCFHMIRRQMIRPYRKPLIVMTPKSLLRHKLVVSSLDDLAHGKFHLVISEIDDLNVDDVTRVVVCGGKVYYDLLELRRAEQKNDVAIVRVEQLYPFPEKELTAELAKYKNAKQVVWCQEEPQNQGAWYASYHHFVACLGSGKELLYAGRDGAAAPAVGHLSLHNAQQKALVADALNLSKG